MGLTQPAIVAMSVALIKIDDPICVVCHGRHMLHASA
jgi:hypothetical protein